MLPDGRCGLFVKRKTVEYETPESIKPLRTESLEKVRKKLDKLGI